MFKKTRVKSNQQEIKGKGNLKVAKPELLRSRAHRSVAIKQKLQDLFHSAKLQQQQTADRANCLADLGILHKSGRAKRSEVGWRGVECRTEHDSPYVACKSQCRQQAHIACALS